jgi:cyclophilin family peptidyl-prolyl cis-trans isomerase
VESEFIYSSKLNIFASDFLNIINQPGKFMNIRKYFLLTFVTVFLLSSCSSNKDNRNSFVLIKTTFGDIKVRLYDETPVHRDNFLKLVNNQVYEGVTFHRVIKDFMIQTGDPETKLDYLKGRPDSLLSYTLPAEFNPALFHKKGALAAARQGNEVNPEMRSSGTQFYIVQGIKYSDAELNQAEQRINDNLKQALFVRLIKEITDSNRIAGTNFNENQIQEKASIRMFDIMAAKGDFKIPEDHRNIYKTIGGTPRLDGTYTVFGEVVSGLDVVDRIASVQTDRNDRPLSDIRIIKMRLFYK